MPISRAAARAVLFSLAALLVCASSQQENEDKESKLASGCAACPVLLLDVVAVDGVRGEASHEENSSEAPSEASAPSLEGLRLSEEGLAYLAQQRSPLYLVPALGVYRGGKSLLLNRLMGLRAPYAGGFGVGHGQQTHTRGINICAEQLPDGKGTIIWMDTEGLFSSEDARSSYGPKIFSLALLFSSTVLLNNVKVLNDQFFAFFAEQQQVARVLRQGLQAEGLPEGTLLPGNLSVVWVLQQPISYDATSATSRSQLEAFLGLPGDETRERVQRGFRHLIQEVPAAANDFRLWSKLDQLEDEQLLLEYVDAASMLRSLVLRELASARPMQAASVATQLRMYVELVQNEHFSGALAKEAFEESEIARLCGGFANAAEELAGEMPSTSFPEAFVTSQEDLDSKKKDVVENFHLGAAWIHRLQLCVQERISDLERRNSELVLVKFQTVAREIAEEGGCFFLGRLATVLREDMVTYGKAFSTSAQARAVDFGSALQRTRLVECVRLRDLLFPFVPWLAWPVASFYLRGGAISGLVSMALHGVVLAGIYVLLQLFNQLPPYLNVDYPVLRNHPVLLGVVMRAPPLVPWASMARAFGLLGAARSSWRFLRCCGQLARSAGQGHTVGQLMNLELKLNAVLKRSEALVKQKLIAEALEASEQLDRGDARATARALVRGLVLVTGVGEDDFVLGHVFEARHRKRAREVMAVFELPPKGPQGSKRCNNCRDGPDLATLAVQAEWDALLPRMIEVLEHLVTGRSRRKDSGESDTSMDESSVDLASMISAMSPSPEPKKRGAHSPSPSPSPVTASSCADESSAKPRRRSGPRACLFSDASVEESIIEGSSEDNDELNTTFSEGGTDEVSDDDVLQEEKTGANWLRWLAVTLSTLAGFGISAALLQAGNDAGMLPGSAMTGSGPA